MSRLDRFDEILDGAESKASPEPASNKVWKHSYETIDNKAFGVALPAGIKGKFVYQSEKNIVKVSYAGTYVKDAPELAQVDDVQVQLYKKESPSLLESLVTLKSENVYNKRELRKYVPQLQVIEPETADEKPEFSYFKGKFITALNEVIKKILSNDEFMKSLFNKDIIRNLYSDLSPFYSGSMHPLPKKDDILQAYANLGIKFVKPEKSKTLKDMLKDEDICSIFNSNNIPYKLPDKIKKHRDIKLESYYNQVIKDIENIKNIKNIKNENDIKNYNALMIKDIFPKDDDEDSDDAKNKK